MNSTTAKIVFLLYAFISGLTFSALFIVYKVSSIIMVFGVTSALFLIFALIGRYTKLDLSRIGTFLLMMLFGVIILSIISVFVPGLNLMVAIIGLVVFLGYVAYDVQMIKRRSEFMDEDNAAIISAFELYLDFINVFVDLLRIFGDSD